MNLWRSLSAPSRLTWLWGRKCCWTCRWVITWQLAFTTCRMRRKSGWLSHECQYDKGRLVNRSLATDGYQGGGFRCQWRGDPSLAFCWLPGNDRNHASDDA